MTLIEAGQRRRNRAVIAVVVTAAVFLSFVAVMYSSYAGGRGGGAVATETPSPLPVVAVAGSEGVIKLPHRDEAPTFRAEPLLSDAHIVQGGAAKQAQLLDKMGAFWDGRLRWKMRDEMVSNNYSSSSIPPLLSSYPSSQFDSLATVLGEEWRKREEKDTRARASAYYETSQSASPLPIYTGGGEKGHLIELDYQDPSHQLYAEYLIEREVPFVVRRVTDVRRVSLKWGEQYFRQKMKDTKVGVDKSNFDRFMYYTLARGTPSGWVPPQDKEEMSVKSFLITATKEPKAVKPTDMHYYWQVAGGNKEKPEYEWVQQDTAPFCEKTQRNFFNLGGRDSMANVRIGMAGNQAAMHFDDPPNFVFQAVGYKRYVMSPPEDCPYLYMYPKNHPSARHTSVDFNRVDAAKYPLFPSARALSTVLTPGDALYMPANYNHHMESLEFNASVNCRSKIPTSKNGVSRVQVFGYCEGHYTSDIGYAKAPTS